ncbi:hypothetical protein C8R44DRAFT_747317 [Mycena epipterygia]|nr:hypothetical protein C8R44DRAFT_747317 [Mycena epipterygia]
MKPSWRCRHHGLTFPVCTLWYSLEKTKPVTMMVQTVSYQSFASFPALYRPSPKRDETTAARTHIDSDAAKSGPQRKRGVQESEFMLETLDGGCCERKLGGDARITRRGQKASESHQDEETKDGWLQTQTHCVRVVAYNLKVQIAASNAPVTIFRLDCKLGNRMQFPREFRDGDVAPSFLPQVLFKTKL